MKSEKLVIEELSRMKSLFGYERGRVISEQESLGTPAMKIPTQIQKPAPQATTLPDLTPKQKNINNAFCSVKGGKIILPGSQIDGWSWFDWTNTYPDITPAEYEVARKKCPNSELATQQIKQKVTTQKPDPKVMELQKQLIAAGYQLGKSGPNKDGVDGIMGPKTRAAQQQMIQQKGQQALQSMSQQGKNVQNQFNKTIQQNSTLTPQQIANANALKAGQPLPQTKAPVAPVVTDQAPTEPGQFGEIRDGWQWSDKQQKWNKLP
jgi:hypothetical protein